MSLEEVDEYGKYRQGAELPTPEGGRTKWVWFSQNEIQRLLEILSSEFPNHKDTERGIKFYFSIYTNLEDRRQGDTTNYSYKDRLSLVLVPSRIEKDGNTEYFKDIGKGELTEAEKFIGIAAHGAMSDPPFENIGTSCPPRCQNDEGDVL